MDNTVSDYYFYRAETWYKISTSSTDNEEAIQNALNDINSAIKKCEKKEAGDSNKKLEEESESGAKMDLYDASDVELANMKQNKILAEYYYYAGFIHISIFNCGLRFTIANILAAMGKVKYNMAASVIGMIAQLVINPQVIPIYGAFGVAITSCVVYGIMAIYLLGMFVKQYYVNYRNMMKNNKTYISH